MKDFMAWFKKQITIADIAIIIFLIAGFYYTTNYKFDSLAEDVSRNTETAVNHLEYQYRPLRDQVKQNSDRLIRVEGNYENISNLLEQYKKNQDKRFNDIGKQLDYIIERLDNND